MCVLSCLCVVESKLLLKSCTLVQQVCASDSTYGCVRTRRLRENAYLRGA